MLQYSTPAGQAWLRLWVGLYGSGSRLAGYVVPEQGIHRPTISPPRARPLSDTAHLRARPAAAQAPRAKPLNRSERKIERDVQRIARLPTSEWAKRIVGDERIAGITLQDILEGIEDYFEIFDQLRRVNKDAYDYFSRVGAPIVLRNTMAWASQCEAMTVANPAMLPSYFGLFITRTRDQVREAIIDDKPSPYDFHLFEKPKNFATAAPFGTTVFTHQIIALKRNAFSPEELKHHPSARHSWGMWWYLGIGHDGQVRALPQRMQRRQELPNGGYVHHSAFEIPPGLYELGREKNNPHRFVRSAFNVGVAFAVSGLAGIQVTVKKGRQAARFGIPISALKGFFADRDRNGRIRKKPILHLRLGHERHLGDGRIIQVGEHLSGERFFSWRGYDIAVGIPGIHSAAPEGIADALYVVGDPDAPLPPDAPPLTDMASLKWLGKKVRNHTWTDQRNPIRRSAPTFHYTDSGLPRGERRTAPPPGAFGGDH